MPEVSGGEGPARTPARSACRRGPPLRSLSCRAPGGVPAGAPASGIETTASTSRFGRAPIGAGRRQVPAIARETCRQGPRSQGGRRPSAGPRSALDGGGVGAYPGCDQRAQRAERRPSAARSDEVCERSEPASAASQEKVPQAPFRPPMSTTIAKRCPNHPGGRRSPGFPSAEPGCPRAHAGSGAASAK